jgi:hypothetical protein
MSEAPGNGRPVFGRNSAAYWCGMAAVARELMGEASTLRSKQALLDVALDYEARARAVKGTETDTPRAQGRDWLHRPGD